jgi:TPP-dependent pyruvate/acetoin dehydrogenase alpha subunit
MLELRYFRRSGHAQHDPQDYVPAELLAEWEARDPLDRFRRRAVEEGWADEAELDERRSRSEERCRAAAEAVIDEPFPVGETALEDVYSDLPTRPPWTRRDPVDPRAA